MSRRRSKEIARVMEFKPVVDAARKYIAGESQCCSQDIVQELINEIVRLRGEVMLCEYEMDGFAEAWKRREAELLQEIRP